MSNILRKNEEKIVIVCAHSEKSVPLHRQKEQRPYDTKELSKSKEIGYQKDCEDSLG